MFNSAPNSPTAEFALKDDKVINRPELKDSWAIRPCSVYKDEYDDCTSIKARLHQYFIYGESIDCSQWLKDYICCRNYEKSDGFDVKAGEEVINSEAKRREIRFRGHYGNTVWRKRQAPPEDWSKPLPEWMQEKNKNTFLNYKQMEMEGKVPPSNIFEGTTPKLCSIM